MNHRPTLLALLTAVVVAMFGGQASAATLSVCPTWCPYASIQPAVDAATGADTVAVAPGTYVQNVTVPAGKDGLRIAGAQAGVPADTAPNGGRPGGESVVAAANSEAFRIASNRVTVDGFTLEPYVGVRLMPTSSGARIVNTIVRNAGVGVIPNSDGALPTVIRHNLFINDASNPAPYFAVRNELTSDDVYVTHNRFTGVTWAAVWISQSTNVNVLDNRMTPNGSLPPGSVAQLFATKDAVVADNTTTDFAQPGLWLTGNKNLLVKRNSITGGANQKPAVWLDGGSGPNEHVRIVENDLGNNDGPALVVVGGTVDPVEVHFNRLAVNQASFFGSTSGIFNDTGSTVNAQRNWWGCNAGPGAHDCTNTVNVGSGAIDTSPWLQLTVSADPTRIAGKPGWQGNVTASILSDSAGGALDPVDFPRRPIAFLSSVGTLSQPSVALDAGSARNVLTDDSSQSAVVIATLDRQSVATEVAFGPEPPIATGPKGPSGTTGPGGANGPNGAAGAPGPAGAAGPNGPQGAFGQQGAAGPQGPAGPQGSPTTCFDNNLGFVYCTNVAVLNPTTSKAVVKLGLYRGGRRVASRAVTLPRDSSDRVRLRLRVDRGQALRPGRYVLVATRAGHRILRQVVTVGARGG